ncbi:MAG TPA: hypothetical protein VJU54_04830 [Nitrospiraceae bacterium]|nr:hypothetical protein [Nitrospiraceae bacterium]
MKAEHVFQVLVAETAFHEIRINALTAYIARHSNVSLQEIETFIDQYAAERTAEYVASVHMRLKQRIDELEASS